MVIAVISCSDAGAIAARVEGGTHVPVAADRGVVNRPAFLIKGRVAAFAGVSWRRGVYSYTCPADHAPVSVDGHCTLVSPVADRCRTCQIVGTDFWLARAVSVDAEVIVSTKVVVVTSPACRYMDAARRSQTTVVGTFV